MFDQATGTPGPKSRATTQETTTVETTTLRVYESQPLQLIYQSFLFQSRNMFYYFK